MSKPVKYSVAVVLRNDKGEYLAVRRPLDDEDHKGHWGLPAVSLKSGETPDQAALRTCKEKLYCSGKIKRFLGIMYQKRNKYDMFLMDIEMTLDGDRQPDVGKSNTTSTKYIEQLWSDDPMLMMPAAKDGSCCSTIFLSDQGLMEREDWVEDLEGSPNVG